MIMVKINTASIVNIILDKKIIPEYFQGKASVENLTFAIKNLIIEDNIRNKQVQGLDEAIKCVINNTQDPSYLAAKAIMKIV